MRTRETSSRQKLFSFILILIWLAVPAGLAAAAFPQARPAEVGLSAERLERLTAVTQEYVSAGRLPGAVILLVRDGKAAYFRSFGLLDPEKKTPMPTNAIFRIASQSKALTSVAVMMLMEEGKLLLGDRVSKYIPEFKETTVAVQPPEKGATGWSVVPAKRPITVRDLLTHTAGISYGYGPAQALYKEAGVQGWFFADKDEPIGDCVKRLAKLPFDAQPGEKWVYGFNIDILGYLVEVVSGQSLAAFIESRITGPLGMADTHFFLPESKLGKFTPVFGAGKDGALELVERPEKSSYFVGPRKCFSGGAGLLSTAEDYARFLQMLANGGELGGVRVLSPKSVELMTVNHVGRLYGDQGFGLGFWVTEDLGKGSDPGSVGAFGWGGAYFTTYWVDPAEKLVCVFMTQLLPVPAAAADFQAKLKALVYQSIARSYARKQS
jgi:CubicO group peptidase (beta-lactamase class C family)